MKINIDTKIKITPIIITMIVISATLLPIQASIMYAFNLPTLFQLLYPFLIVSFIIILNIPIKKILSSLDYKFLFLFLLLILFQIISSMINSTTIIDFSMKFSNYVLNYSKLLDSPIPRMINWSIFRPFLFFCYILTLFIFLNFKNGIKIHTKSLICLGLLSVIYSIYQIVAAYLGLPFGAIFSGHNGQEIFLLGNIRRVEGLFFEPGPQATFLIFILSLLISQLFEKNQEFLFLKKNTLKIFIFLTIIILIFTFSPVAFLGLFFVTLFFLIFKYQKIVSCFKNRKVFIYTLIVLIILFFIFYATIIYLHNNSLNFNLLFYMKNKIMNSLFSMDSYIVYSNLDSRSVRSYAGMQMFKDNFLFGVGAGGAIVHYIKYVPFATGTYKILGTQTILNTYIKFLAEFGIIGFSIFMLIVLYPIYLFLKYYKRIKKSKYNNLIQAYLIAYLLHIMFSYQANPQFWMVLNWLIYIPLIILIRKTKSTIYIMEKCIK